MKKIFFPFLFKVKWYFFQFLFSPKKERKNSHNPIDCKKNSLDCLGKLGFCVSTEVFVSDWKRYVLFWDWDGGKFWNLILIEFGGNFEISIGLFKGGHCRFNFLVNLSFSLEISLRLTSDKTFMIFLSLWFFPWKQKLLKFN